APLASDLFDGLLNSISSVGVARSISSAASAASSLGSPNSTSNRAGSGSFAWPPPSSYLTPSGISFGLPGHANVGGSNGLDLLLANSSSPGSSSSSVSSSGSHRPRPEAVSQ